MAEIDNETFELLSQIIIEGHDGSHPHLPVLTKKKSNNFIWIYEGCPIPTFR